MITRYDDVLTKPVDWSWTFGLDHDPDPDEPSSDLLPGRVDAPASTKDGSSAMGQFTSQSAAEGAADALVGICVAETVILPGQPYPWGDATDQEALRDVVDRLTKAGARAAFITDADTGYMTFLDIRAHCESRDGALAIGRQMVPLAPPFHEGLIKPWAPGRKLSEDQVRARMYLASLERSEQTPRDELESRIWDIWRAWREDQMATARRLVAAAPDYPANAMDDIGAAIKKHKAALSPFLGAEADERGLPWHLQLQVLVDGRDLCLSSVWGIRLATSFPALVRWLQGSGVRSARYSVYNLIRP